jgi:sterol 3beta-glucosyltransferase
VLSNTGCILSRCSEPNGVNGFHDLVEKDLDVSEQAIVGRLTKLRVAGDTWIAGDLTAEPESYDAADQVSPVDDLEPKAPILHRVVVTSEEESWKLGPDEIVHLLVQEFGPLAEEGEEEKLILETDGCLIHDVVIVVHPFSPLLFDQS